MNRFAPITVILLLCCANAHAGVLVDCEKHVLSVSAGEWGSLQDSDSHRRNISENERAFLEFDGDLQADISLELIRIESSVEHQPAVGPLLSIESEKSSNVARDGPLRPV